MNLRVIKKDIDFLMKDFVDDCLLFAMLHPEKDLTKVEDLINEANAMANDLFDRVNSWKKDCDNNAKAYFKAISVDLMKGLDGLCDKLSALAK